MRNVVKGGHAPPARPADPSPFRHQTPTPEKIGRDIEAIEPVHVLGRVDAMQNDGVHECESESLQDIGQGKVMPLRARSALADLPAQFARFGAFLLSCRKGD